MFERKKKLVPEPRDIKTSTLTKMKTIGELTMHNNAIDHNILPEQIEKFLSSMSAAPVITNAQLVHFFNVSIEIANKIFNEIVEKHDYEQIYDETPPKFYIVVLHDETMYALEERMYNFLDGNINYVSDKILHDLKMCNK